MIDVITATELPPVLPPAGDWRDQRDDCRRYGRAEGLRGGQHIAHRLALASINGLGLRNEVKGQAICGARILSINIDSLMPAQCNVLGVTCRDCESIAWRGHGNEERR